MKKLIGLFTVILFAVSIAMVACKAEVHTHTFSSKWTSDETNHWHDATCEHKDKVIDKAKHTFGDWTITKEATEEAEGSKERTCTVCGYTATESIVKLPHTHKFATDWTKDETNHWHASTCGHEDEVVNFEEHSFGEWTVTKEPTEEAEGSREKSCTVCEYTVPEVIAKLEHTHKFAESLTKDETHHWYASTCGHEVTEGKTAHTFGDWITTKAATEEETGSKERVCDVCKYIDTEAIEKLAHTHKFATDWTKDETNHWHASTCGHEVTEGKTAHTFGDWITTKAATCTEDGNKTRTCEVCKKEVIEKIDAKGHNYSETWTSDAENHWYASTCGHEVTEGKTAHTFGDWITTKEATCTEEGERKTTCTICGYEKTEGTDKAEHTIVDEVCSICGYSRIPKGFVLVKGTTITGEESWTPSSDVFVSERKLTIPDLIVSDHEVTRGEYKACMGSDPSKASANDKDGKELEGDDALNNPVNYINWYDALVYCNKLSMKENLTPCYSIDGSTDPAAWGEVPTSSNSTWDAATCNFKANGYRLPTEAEWEWLARGGENYTYAGSDTINDVAWYRSNKNDTETREVKTKAPNGYGLYDMSGNVWEWCWDWYGSISSSSAADGATSGVCRVIRGGCWFNDDLYCQVAYRYDDVPIRRGNLGFRVVRPSSK